MRISRTLCWGAATALAAMERAVLVRVGRIVLGANQIVRTEGEPIKRARKQRRRARGAQPPCGLIVTALFDNA